MPALPKPRHELFAQSVANGNEIGKAYIDAGFKPNSGNPSTLKARKDVERRIAELLEERANKTLAKTVSEVHYTRETLLAQLEEARALALEKNQPSAAVSATVGMARILGLIIDRREVGDAGAFDAFTDDELVAAAAKKARELGIGGPRSIDLVVEEVLEAGADNPVDDDVEPT